MTLEKGTRIVLPMRRGVVESSLAINDDGVEVARILFDDGNLGFIQSTDNWCEEAFLPAEPSTLRDAIEEVINKHSAENGSNTPDFILANHLIGCIANFDATTKQRDEWWENRSLEGVAGFGRDAELLDRPTANPAEPPPRFKIRPTANPAEPPPPPRFKIGDRVFHRKPDLFGEVLDFPDPLTATVRYEPWVYDGPPAAVPLSELVPASEVER
jgi:hypothetical protein